MTMINEFILTSAENDTAMGLDSPANGVEVEGRLIDNASPGVGINLNDQATSYAAGAVVSLAGMYVIPKRVVDNPDYQTHCPSLITYLLTKPYCTIETETVFAPSP